MKLAITIMETSEGGFRASCPSLPGCVARGRSIDDAREQIGRAVEGYLASLDVAVPQAMGDYLESNVVPAAAGKEW